VLAALCCTIAWTASCAPSRAVRAGTQFDSPSADADATPRAIGPDDAAAIALARSSRIEAAARRFDAASARAELSALPPDPTIALALGIPVDGLGGTGLSASIGAAIGWLFTRDADMRAASSAASSAAEELVWTARMVAADARAAAREAALARAAQRSATEALAAARSRESSLSAAIAASDAPRSALIEARSETLALEQELALRDAAEAVAALELESLLGERCAGNLSIENCLGFADRTTAPPAGSNAADGAPAVVTIESIRAAREVADARASLARLESPIGSASQISAGYAQDLEDRRSVETGLSLTVPLFRRDLALAASRDDLAAAEADLAEALRVATLAHAGALAHLQGARAGLESLRMRRALADEALAASQAAHQAGEQSAMQVSADGLLAARARLDELDGARELARAIAALERLRDAGATTRITAEGRAR
jgi:outer membrane protein TolC